MHDDTEADTPAYLTTRELAARWGLSTQTLLAARRDGRGPQHVRLGGSIRYARTEVLRIEHEGGWR